jgi:ATP-dependent exoDNAse (exonuclease V) beta subunit
VGEPVKAGDTSIEQPTAEQFEAIECHDRDILVEAGAGTGKTKTTIARYRRLLSDGHEPGEILVFTFTDKAAAELRNRARETPEGEPEVAMGAAWIGTFHSICSRILRAHPVAADVDPRFDVLDDVKGRRIRDAAFERALREVSEDRRSAEQLSRVKLASWKTGVTTAYDQLRARGEERPSLPEVAGADGDSPGGFPVFCRNLVDRLLNSYGDAYSDMKRAEGLLDYEDLQLQTLKLLENNPGVSHSYSERFVEIMVDEFQDTNRLQVRLIEALRGEQTTLFTVGDEMQAIYGFRHADVRLFRQRREQVDLPLGLTANFRSQAPVIGAVNLIGRGLDRQVDEGRGAVGTGSTGREGQGSATAASRQEFAELTVGLDPEPGRRSSVEMLFVGSDGWQEQELGPLSPSDAKDQGKTEAATRAEALAVARRVREAVDRGEVDVSQVALLFRTRSNMPIHAEALAHYGLEPYIVGRSDFWSSREAIDVLALLAVVANPLDDESLLSPLLGPACGLSSDALVLLRDATESGPIWPTLTKASRGEVDGVQADDCERARSFVTAIEAVRSALPVTPLGEVVEGVVTSTGYDLACLGRGRPVERMANLRRIGSLAAEYEASEARDLRGFLRWAEDSSDLEAESGVATEEESGRVVRLMTIHKAKGLEFDMVCVPDLGKERRAPGSGVRICWIGPDGNDEPPRDGEAGENGQDPSLTLGLRVVDEQGSQGEFFDWDAIRDAAEIEQEDEELRLFHVAVTRARRLLVLSGIHPLESKDPAVRENTAGRLYRWALTSTDGEDGGLPSTIAVPAPASGAHLESEPKATEIKVEAIPATEKGADELGRGRETEAVQPGAGVTGRPPLGRPGRSRRPDVPLSFTTLSVLADCPARFFATRVLKLEEPESAWAARDPEDQEEVALDPEESSPLTVREATAFGSVVHDLLEASAQRRWVRPAESEISARLEGRGLNTGDGRLQERAADMIYGFMDSPLGRRVAGQSCDPETPLLLDAGGITIRGFADLLARDVSPPLILDYKSNNLQGTTAAAKMAEQYDLQRDLYGLAVADGLEAETVDTAFVFLEDVENPVEMRLGQEELARARDRVDSLVTTIRTGSFFGESAAAIPCGECWACERLESRLVTTRKRQAGAG